MAAVAPHMHLFGTRVRVEHIREDGSEACLVDIPRWDFNWQMPYRLHRDAYVEIPPGEAVRLTCHYDNSPANQPIIDGAPMAPADLFWGDGTLDEMCLAYISVLEPYEANRGDCDLFSECTARCDEPDGFGCWVDCLAGNLGCAQCALGEMIGDEGCLVRECAMEGLAVRGCFTDCIFEGASGGSVVSCVERDCPEGWDALRTCMDPMVAAGQCDAHVEECGGEL